MTSTEPWKQPRPISATAVIAKSFNLLDLIVNSFCILIVYFFSLAAIRFPVNQNLVRDQDNNLKPITENSHYPFVG